MPNTLHTNFGPDLNRLADRAKWAFTTRNVPQTLADGLDKHVDRAQPGDLLLGQIKKIGGHRRLQTRHGTHSTFFLDDLVVATLGARFATDQFEGLAECNPDGTADLLAGGGVIGRLRRRKAGIKPPTTIKVLGRITNRHGKVINVAAHGLTPASDNRPQIVLGVIGSAMNAGKTDSAAGLIHGLELLGHRTAGIKLTGTGSFGDLASYRDAGASCALDFTDAGMESTYMQPLDRVIAGFDTLLDAAGEAGCQITVVELADGITQVETAALLGRPDVVARFDGFIMAAGDALSALGGIGFLAHRGITPLAISGVLTQTPLAVDELKQHTKIPVLSRGALADPATASTVLVKISGANKMWVA